MESRGPEIEGRPPVRKRGQRREFRPNYLSFSGTYECNLACAHCCVPIEWKDRLEIPAATRFLESAHEAGIRILGFTGGEPLIQPDVQELCAAIVADGWHLTIETAGTVFRPVAMSLLSLSPKLANSVPHKREQGRFARAHDAVRLNFEAMQQLLEVAPDRQIKFVVTAGSDLLEIEQVLSRLRGWRHEDVMLMPEGIDAQTLQSRAPWLVEVCKRTGYRLCPRLQIQLFGNQRAT